MCAHKQDRFRSTRISGSQQDNLSSTLFVMLGIVPDGPDGQVGKGEP
jgi:hypothetical protein